MNYLVIGLGSMGTRRVRNLKALGVSPVAGVDPRMDRRGRAAEGYRIKTFANLEDALQEFDPHVFVISTPPDTHMDYAYAALERGISCFIEASVVGADRILQLSCRIAGTTILMAPSCTMRYFPGPRKIKELIGGGVIGRVLNVNYQTGQYLPDWHPWETIEDYYVSKRDTGGAREIVPFELTWLNDIFGRPHVVGCYRGKLTELPVDIDDVFHCLLRYDQNVIVNMTVEVISRPKATRHMRVLGTQGEIVFDGDANSVRHINTSMNAWKEVRFDAGTIENQYINPEEPYIAEMRDFVGAVVSGNRAAFPNSLQDDYRVLQTLDGLERISGG